MAGVKGRSGGARSGAGRKPKEPVITGHTDPLDFLQAVWTGEIEATVAQVRAATAALPFKHKKLGEGSKADAGKQAADAAATGRFATRTGPRAKTTH